jgi:tRNA modification GTPase
MSSPLPVPAGTPVVRLSALTGAGLEHLEAAISTLFPADQTAIPGTLLTNARQADAVERALRCIEAAEESLLAEMTPDVVLTETEQALESLNELTGTHVRDDLVETIFSRFCVGK